ncbi:hypothetical protein M9434_000500 [Picochlorum sp. BPE23]|nr:hypothetical protein M9434_000500 [Picochlorum sp. BPE23]KAI8106537.1 hypothetical protein M9435_001080 [Picochlorum sp. BPE23]
MDLNDVGAQLDPENDEVFISGLPTDTTEQDIADYFGQIGIIKQDKKRRGMPKVWLYKNKETGEFNGDATVTYEDAFAAMSAPKWFDGKEFKGAVLKVSMSNRKAEAAAAYEKKMQERGDQGGYHDHRGRGRGGYGGRDEYRGGGGGGRGRPGDWACPKCGNNCFARKDSCNRCGTPKPRGYGGDSSSGGYGGRGGGRGGGGGRREGDWMCACGNNCFGWRDVCNRCGAPKPGGGGGGGGGGDRSRRHDRGDDRRRYDDRRRHDDRRRDRSRSPRQSNHQYDRRY